MNGTISPNRIITFDELETMYNICAGDVADTPAATPHVTDVPGPIIAPMRPIGVEEMARTFNISNEPVTDVPASTPNAGAGLSRVPLVAPVPDYPRIPAPLLEHTKEMGIINALSSAASYLEHMAGIEEETAHSEGWNFDASVELISLSRRLGRIPFGGPTEKCTTSAHLSHQKERSGKRSKPRRVRKTNDLQSGPQTFHRRMVGEASASSSSKQRSALSNGSDAD